MSSTTQEKLLESFIEAMGSQQRGSDVAQALVPAASTLVSTSSGFDAASEAAVGSNYRPAPATSASTQSSSGSTAASLATSFFESGFGIVPLITGLLGLFSGGSSTPPPLTKYEMPSPISFEAADIGGQVIDSDYDQTGLPRLYSGASGMDDAPEVAAGETATGAGAPGIAPAPQITVNVQAMDAQSFMDRSNDIAQAVRQAMLNSNAINDVVNDL